MWQRVAPGETIGSEGATASGGRGRAAGGWGRPNVLPGDVSGGPIPPHVAWSSTATDVGPTPGVEAHRGACRRRGSAVRHGRGRLELGIKWLTVYAFSTENWKHPPDEVRYLMGFNQSILGHRRRDRMERAGRAHALRQPPRLAGARAPHPPPGPIGGADPRRPDHDLHHRLQLPGGRAEIVDAVKAGWWPRACRPTRWIGRAVRRHVYDPDMPDPISWCARRRVPHLQLPAVGDRLQRAGVHRRALRPTSGASTCSPRSATSNGANAATAG